MTSEPSPEEIILLIDVCKESLGPVTSSGLSELMEEAEVSFLMIFSE